MTVFFQFLVSLLKNLHGRQRDWRSGCKFRRESVRRFEAHPRRREGGVDIEEVAAATPEKILRETADPGVGLQPFQATRLAFGLGFEGKQVRQAAGFILNLYKAFVGADCSIVEINPLVTTTDGQVLALDAKINFDDNALFRHQDFVELRDLDEVEELGFQFLAKELLVSHAYVHLVEFGGPVTVGGITVHPGDLLHADKHGALQIPHDIAPQVADAAQAVEDRERVIINFTQSDEFSRSGLAELMGGHPSREEETP